MVGTPLSKKVLILDWENHGYQDIIIPMHNKDLPKGLLLKLMKSSGLA